MQRNGNNRHLNSLGLQLLHHLHWIQIRWWDHYSKCQQLRNLLMMTMTASTILKTQNLNRHWSNFKQQSTTQWSQIFLRLKLQSILSLPTPTMAQLISLQSYQPLQTSLSMESFSPLLTTNSTFDLRTIEVSSLSNNTEKYNKRKAIIEQDFFSVLANHCIYRLYVLTRWSKTPQKQRLLNWELLVYSLVHIKVSYCGNKNLSTDPILYAQAWSKAQYEPGKVATHFWTLISAFLKRDVNYLQKDFSDKGMFVGDYWWCFVEAITHFDSICFSFSFIQANSKLTGKLSLELPKNISSLLEYCQISPSVTSIGIRSKPKLCWIKTTSLIPSTISNILFGVPWRIVCFSGAFGELSKQAACVGRILYKGSKHREFASIPFANLKSKHSGQKNQALLLQKISMDSSNTKKVTMPCPYNLDPLSLVTKQPWGSLKWCQTLPQWKVLKGVVRSSESLLLRPSLECGPSKAILNRICWPSAIESLGRTRSMTLSRKLLFFASMMTQRSVLPMGNATVTYQLLGTRRTAVILKLSNKLVDMHISKQHVAILNQISRLTMISCRQRSVLQMLFKTNLLWTPNQMLFIQLRWVFQRGFGSFDSA